VKHATIADLFDKWQDAIDDADGEAYE
jgi:hypothetical protein